MVNRPAKSLAHLAIAAALLATWPGVAAASPAPPQPVPIFNGWTFAEWFPALQQQATEAFNALGPVGYLVMAAILTGLVLETLLHTVWVASRGPDDDDS